MAMTSATKAANCDHQAKIKAVVPKLSKRGSTVVALQKSRKQRVTTNDDDGQGGQGS